MKKKRNSFFDRLNKLYNHYFLVGENPYSNFVETLAVDHEEVFERIDDAIFMGMGLESYPYDPVHWTPNIHSYYPLSQ